MNKEAAFQTGGNKKALLIYKRVGLFKFYISFDYLTFG